MNFRPRLFFGGTEAIKDEVAERLIGVGKTNSALLGLQYNVPGGLGCGLEREE